MPGVMEIKKAVGKNRANKVKSIKAASFENKLKKALNLIHSKEQTENK